MPERHAHVDCPFCPLVLEHHGDRPRLGEALEFHISVKHPTAVSTPVTRRRIVAAACADLRVALWNAAVARPRKRWDHR